MRVDFIVKELAAHRLLHQGGEDIQNAAPQGKLPHALHLIAPGVARPAAVDPSKSADPSAAPRAGGWTAPSSRTGGRVRSSRASTVATTMLPLSGSQTAESGQPASAPTPGRPPPPGGAAIPGQAAPPAPRPVRVCRSPASCRASRSSAQRKTPGAPCAPGNGRPQAGALHRLRSGDRSGAASLLHALYQLRGLRKRL